MRGDKVALAALLLLLFGFAVGLLTLARERYTRGDGYPPGSSYRTDPLGARALHDALREIDGVEARRHTGPAWHLRGGAGTVVLLLETRDVLGSVDPDLVRAVESVALGGGRVLVSLAGRETAWYDKKEEEDEDEDEDAASEDEEQEEENDEKKGDESIPPLSPGLGERWGFASRPCPETIAPTEAAVPVAGLGTDTDLPWRGGDCLDELSLAWRPLYHRGEHVAVAERPLGRGTIVLLADGYVLSNEALLFDPRPEALAILLGRPDRVVFEESHHGVRERTGIAALIGRYHLRPALAVVTLLFALWVWWAATPLVPQARSADAGSRAGRDASLGLVSLLRRGLPAQRLVPACVEQWRTAFGRSRPAVAEALKRLTFEGRDLPALYRRARETVNPGRNEHAR